MHGKEAVTVQQCMERLERPLYAEPSVASGSTTANRMGSGHFRSLVHAALFFPSQSLAIVASATSRDLIRRSLRLGSDAQRFSSDSARIRAFVLAIREG